MKQKAAFLKSGWAILAGIVAGLALGYFRKMDPSLLRWTGDCSRIYIRLLEMCVLPILFTAIAASIGNLATSRQSSTFLRRIITSLVALIMISSLVGGLVGIVVKPGSLPIELRERLGRIISDNVGHLEMTINSSPELRHERNGLLSFIHDAIPANAVRAFVDNINLQVLLLAVIVGIAMGLHAKRSEKLENSTLLGSINELYQCFSMILGWVMLLLPFGLCFILGEAAVHMSDAVVSVLKSLVLSFLGSCAVLSAISVLIIWHRSPSTLSQVLARLRSPVLIALGTRSSIATIPSAIQSLSFGLGFNQNSTKLVLPLSITLGRFGNGLYFAVVATFVAQLYEHPISIGAFCIIVLASASAGIATSGGSGIATLSLLSIVLSSLGLPLGPILILLIAIDALIDPLRTLMNVLLACVVTALACEEAHESATGTTSNMEAPECAADSYC